MTLQKNDRNYVNQLLEIKLSACRLLSVLEDVTVSAEVYCYGLPEMLVLPELF